MRNRPRRKVLAGRIRGWYHAGPMDPVCEDRGEERMLEPGEPLPPAPPGGGFGEVWRLAYPIVITMASASLMGVVDTLFMGWVGTPEQGAVGLGAVVNWTCLSLFTGTITSTNTFVAQFYGAGDHPAIGRVVWQALYFALASYAAVAAGLIPHTDTLLGAIGSSHEVTGHAVAYLDIRLGGAVFIFANFCVVGFLRGVGDTRTPMKVVLATNVLNVALTWALVFGKMGFPALGVRGAAAGTVASQAVATVIYLVLFFRGKNACYHTRGPHPPSWALLRRWLRVGLPTGVWRVLQMGGFTVFTVFVATLGDEVLAGHQIVRQMMHLSFLPGMALSVTATILVGQYIGIGDLQAATRSAYTAMKIGALIMGTISLSFVLLRHPIAALFSPDPAVQEVAADLFFFVAVFQTVDAVGTVSSGAIRGAGDTRWPMIVSILMSWLFFVPGIFLLGKVAGLGVYGAWSGATLHILGLAALMFGRFRRGKWKTMKI